MDPINDLYQIIFISIFLVFGKFIYTIFDIGSEHFPLIKNFRPRLSSKETIYLTNKLIKDIENMIMIHFIEKNYWSVLIKQNMMMI